MSNIVREEKETRQLLLRENPSKLFLRYLVPGVTATMMVAMNYFVDTLCVGQTLGESGLAALNVSQPVAGFLYGIGYLLGVGGSTLYASYLGKGDAKQARSVYTTCFMALLIVMGVIMLLGLVFLGPIVRFLGGVDTLYAGTREYVLFIFLFTPCFAAETFLITFVRSDGAPRISMLATLCGCTLNIVLDVLFLAGFGWGLWAASLATSLAVLCSSSILLLSTMRKKCGLKLVKKGFVPRELCASARIGLPSFLQEMTSAVVTLMFNSVLLKISGEVAVAVYGVIASMSLVVTSGLAGVSNAMHPLVSINAGAGKKARVRSFLQMAIVSSLCVSTAFFLMGELMPATLIRIFILPSEEFMALAIPGVRIVSVSYLLIAANVLFGVYFQSVQAAGEAFVLTLVRGVVLPVIMVTGCAIFWGVTGAWASTILAEFAALVIVVGLFVRVMRHQKERNYAGLRYFGRRKVQQTIDGILTELGADDLEDFRAMMLICNKVDERNCGIPAFVGMDDLTSSYEGDYAPAYDDEDMGLLLAVGGLLFTDLYEQDDTYIREKKLDDSYPAAAPAMSALARKCFQFTYDEETEETTIISYPCQNKESEDMIL
ncbi:MAG: MATE family efflux transporter [Ruthenibacterium sp.]